MMEVKQKNPYDGGIDDDNAKRSSAGGWVWYLSDDKEEEDEGKAVNLKFKTIPGVKVSSPPREGMIQWEPTPHEPRLNTKSKEKKGLTMVQKILITIGLLTIKKQNER